MGLSSFRRRQGLWLISGLLLAGYDRCMYGWMDGCLLGSLTRLDRSAWMMVWYGMDEGMKGGIHVLVTEYVYVIV